MSDIAVSWIMLGAMVGLAWLLTTLDGPALLGIAVSAVSGAAALARRIA
ncbi:MAG: hypothetical protein AAFR96_02490 [Planctomycetota bacterium]